VGIIMALLAMGTRKKILVSGNFALKRWWRWRYTHEATALFRSLYSAIELLFDPYDGRLCRNLENESSPREKPDVDGSDQGKSADPEIAYP